MAFQSLYRKYRPQTFGALVGQEPVSTALRNAVREGRVGHAYLFSGPRGTGKTTTARLLAKAVNCEQRATDGEPCNVCPSCTEITAGTSLDVVELDAASNRGISEMRTLLERVSYRSAGGARKVYIVDEVHMLTKEASTALLKTLEEPPAHVVFVLATTDPQMVLPTVKSRTQHFEFSLLRADALAAHLGAVAKLEGVEAESETLDLVARRAGGSARDALSLLDQALAYGEGRLDREQVKVLLGGSALASRTAVLDAVGAGDVPGLLERLDALLGAGTDARTLADDLLRHLREVFLVSQGAGRLEAPEEERAALATQGAALGPALIVRGLETLGEAAVEIRRAHDPRLVLEVALVRLARRDTTTVEALTERLARLERALDELRRGGVAPPVTQSAPTRASGASPATEPVAAPPTGPRAALGALSQQAAPPPAAAPAPAPPSEPIPAENPRADAGAAAVPVVLEHVVLAWPGALDHLKPRLKAMVRESRPIRVEGDAVVLGLPARFSGVHLPTITGEARIVADALGAELGRKVTIRVETAEESSPPPGTTADHAPSDEDDIRDEHRAAPSVTGVGPGGGLDSPVGLVIETFGATIESETVRD